MMRIFLFSLMMTMCCWPAHAALSILVETRDGILYIDKEGAEKIGNIVRVMSTQDFHKPQTLKSYEYFSAKAWYDVDCDGKKIRQVSLEIFPENMAMGGSLDNDTQVQAWITPDQGSRQAAIWKGICTQR
jgi:hypothetical protein